MRVVKLSVISRINLGFGWLLFSIAALALVAILGKSWINEPLARIRATTETSAHVLTLSGEVTTAQQAALRYRAWPSAEGAEAAEEAFAAVLRNSDRVRDDLADAPDAAAMAAAVNSAATDYLQAFRELVALQTRRDELVEQFIALGSEKTRAVETVLTSAQWSNNLSSVYQSGVTAARFMDVRRATLRYLMTSAAEDADSARVAIDRAIGAAESLVGLLENEDHRALAEGARAGLVEYRAAFDAVVEAVTARDAIGAEALDVLGPQMVKTFDDLAHLIAERGGSAGEDGKATIDAVALLSIALAAVALVSGLIAAFFLGRGVSRPLRGLVGAVEAASRGEATTVPGLERHDEIGALAKAVAAGEEQRIEAMRLARGLNTTEMFVMLADPDNRIVYVNEPLREMLQGQEADIRRDLPEFDASSLIGAHIDVFHGKSSRHHRVLSNLSGKHRADIALGSGRFKLAISPIAGQTGEKIGTIVEWRDVTAELRATEEIDAVVAAAVEGDFARRADVADAPPQLREMGERVNKVAETVDVSVAETRRALLRMSEGDLTQTMEGEFKGAFGDLQASVNATIERVANLVGDIQSSVVKMKRSTDDIAKGASELSARAESQASSLEENVATMEEMTATIKANAENAESAGALSGDAAEKARRGGGVVEETVSAMARIEEGSTKISDIIAVIDGIAFQTNLLALNAAVEAARAGDAGKGFAVVASEVRTLAQRSAEAARDIKQLIAENSSQVSDGVELVSRTGGALEEIIGAIEKVAQTVHEISNASREQSAGVQEISTSISHMDQITQQNSAMADESASASRALAAESERLAELVRFFRIQGGVALEATADDDWRATADAAAADAPQPAAKKPAKSAATPAADPSSEPVVESVAAAGGGAVKDDWTEF